MKSNIVSGSVRYIEDSAITADALKLLTKNAKFLLVK